MLAHTQRAAALLVLLLSAVAAQTITSYAPMGPVKLSVSGGTLWVVVDFPRWDGYFQNTITLQPGAPPAPQDRRASALAGLWVVG